MALGTRAVVGNERAEHADIGGIPGVEDVRLEAAECADAQPPVVGSLAVLAVLHRSARHRAERADVGEPQVPRARA